MLILHVLFFTVRWVQVGITVCDMSATCWYNDMVHGTMA